jgi:NADPH:quinone reductase-like Zn-dependent oxidoreductase
MRAVQIIRFGGRDVLDVVDLTDPVPGDGEQLYEVTAVGINVADTHQSLSRDLDQEDSVTDVALAAPALDVVTPGRSTLRWGRRSDGSVTRREGGRSPRR